MILAILKGAIIGALLASLLWFMPDDFGHGYSSVGPYYAAVGG